MIQHFDFNYGTIQLKGQPGDYRLVYCTTEEGCKITGWYLFYTANNQIDLIAFIFPCWDIEPAVSGNPPNNLNPICNIDSLLSLTNPIHFRYAQPIANTPSIPQSITQFGSNGKEVIGGFTMDNQGNSYFFGLTDGNLDGQSDSENEIFIIKLSPKGQQLWVTELPMKEGTLLKAGITDGTHLYVAGRTLGSLPGFTNAGRWDVILLKLNVSDGQIVATDQWGNAGIDGYGNITQDDAGNIFVSAQGSPPGPATTDDVYLVAKHQKSNLQNVWRALHAPNATGFIASAEAWGGLTYVPGGAPGVGRLIVGGWYFSNLGANAFVSVYENLHTNSPSRPHSIIINTPGARAEWVLDNKTDKLGNIYVAGFTTGNLQGTHLGEGDAFIIKYSPQLTNPIIKQFGTSKSDLVRKLAIDKNNNVYAVGYTYGHYNGANNSDPTLNSGDIFIQKFDQNLNLLSSRQFGTPHEDRGYCYLADSILFIGGMTEGVMKNTNYGSFDGFLLALDTQDLSFYNTDAPLSLTEQKFVVLKKGAFAELSWEIKSENLEKITIEHKPEKSLHFVSISEEMVTHNSNLLYSQQWLHKNPSPGLNYYRMRYTFKEGPDYISETRAVNFEDLTQMVRFIPNPFSTSFTVYSNNSTANWEIKIFNGAGTLLKVWCGSGTKQIYTRDLPKGLYWVQCNLGGE